MVAEFRRDDTRTPVVLMGYANPIERFGRREFAAAAERSGVDGVLVVDYPPEECAEFAQDLRAHGVDPIFLLAPTSTEARVAAVAEHASGYVYYVSLKGITGAGHLDTESVAARVPAIRACTRVPVGVGFGIRDAASAQAVARVADAVVIGSRLIQEMESVSAGARRARRGRLARRHPPRARRIEGQGNQGGCMSWIDKLLPPRIKQGTTRKIVPEGVWTKCPSCEAVLYSEELERTLHVCPKCSHHTAHRRARALDALLDPEGRYEIGQEVIPVDALKFKDSAQVSASGCRRRMAETEETDALVVHGRLDPHASGRRRLLRVRLHGRLDGFGRRRALRARRADVRSSRRCRSSASPPPAARACRKACCRCCRWPRRRR